MRIRVLVTSAVLIVALCSAIAKALPQPEPQALQPAEPYNTSPPASSFHVYAATTGPFNFIASRGAAWLRTNATVQDLSQLDSTASENQIVIGDPQTSTLIQSLAQAV